MRAQAKAAAMFKKGTSSKGSEPDLDDPLQARGGGSKHTRNPYRDLFSWDVSERVRLITAPPRGGGGQSPGAKSNNSTTSSFQMIDTSDEDSDDNG